MINDHVLPASNLPSSPFAVGVRVLNAATPSALFSAALDATPQLTTRSITAAVGGPSNVKYPQNAGD